MTDREGKGMERQWLDSGVVVDFGRKWRMRKCTANDRSSEQICGPGLSFGTYSTGCTVTVTRII